jgi:hypothetical protein
VPMPVAFQPREYGSAKSYASFTTTGDKPAAGNKPAEDIEKLWE